MDSHLQDLVLQYKEQPDRQTLDSIRNHLLQYFYSRPIRGLDDEQKHELCISLFVSTDPGRPSTLENSLRHYDPQRLTREGHTRLFFPFFFDLARKRMKSILLRSARSRGRSIGGDRQMISFFPVEPDELQQRTPDQERVQSDVLRDLLSEELVPLILQAGRAISNRNYRDPFLFLLLFPSQLSQQEVADLFGIHANTINANLKRAHEQFSRAFNRLVREQSQLDPELVRTALNLLAGEVQGSLQQALESAHNAEIIRARFFQGLSRQQVCEQFDLEEKELRVLEHKVLRDFLAQMEQLQEHAVLRTAVGGPEMEFMEQFAQYMQAPPCSERTRAPLALDGEAFTCFEIVKQVLPSPLQRRHRRVQAALQHIPDNALDHFCQEQEITPGQLALLLQQPSHNWELFQSLENFLGLPSPAPEAGDQSAFAAYLDSLDHG